MAPLTKGQKAKLQKKRKKAERRAAEEATAAASAAPPPAAAAAADDASSDDMAYTSAAFDEASQVNGAAPSAADLAEFKRIFGTFTSADILTDPAARAAAEAAEAAAEAAAGGLGGEADEDAEDAAAAAAAAAEPAAEPKLSRKKRKLLSRLSVAELKQLVARPDVVEAHDVTSSNPQLVCFLKSYRNTVPVPRHWCHKRKYLQGKRGIEKPPFELPEFIAHTGIQKIRQAVMEQEDAKKAKQKMRERVAPKMGKIDIDYQILHDAFFRYQTKPALSGHGEIYYEGKEFEVKLHSKRPGALSGALRAALGMPEGAPPPWLINMQRYGPPPAYPSLKIAGLNAPIPAGAGFGYHPGGWGKPPVDEYGRPLYGDVFGTAAAKNAAETANAVPEDKTLWGALGADESESEDESEDEYEADDTGTATGTGTETSMGTETEAAVFAGIATAGGADGIDLRKRGSEEPSPPRELYQVVKTREEKVGNGLFGSDKVYDMAAHGLGGAASVSGTASVSDPVVLKRAAEDDDDLGGGKRFKF